ncbi:MAG: tRNA-intron lyase [archaeon]
MAVLSSEGILVNEPEWVEKLEKRAMGEKQGENLVLSPEEATYLLEKNENFEIKDSSGKTYSFEEIFRFFQKKDKEFFRKYIVYKDLKDRGYCVKTGFKFGTHFRVYARGDRPGQGHAIWLVHAVPENYVCKFTEISRAIRLAHNVRKKLLFGVVDAEGSVTYYKLEWVTL